MPAQIEPSARVDRQICRLRIVTVSSVVGTSLPAPDRRFGACRHAAGLAEGFGDRRCALLSGLYFPLLSTCGTPVCRSAPLIELYTRCPVPASLAISATALPRRSSAATPSRVTCGPVIMVSTRRNGDAENW